MIFSKRSNYISLLKASLLTLAAFCLALPTTSYAQQAPKDSPRTLLEDGTYLFGQSPSPDVIGSTYAVLSVRDNRTVGAFYRPRSSYDCFSGQLSSGQLNVNVVDSYSGEVYPYSVALDVSDALVAGEGAGNQTLEGFHRIGGLSDKDAEVLSVCEADFAQ